MVCGITGKFFQSADRVSDACGSGVNVEGFVGRGVIGENFFAFCVAVESGADDLLSESSAGKVCVGTLIGVVIGDGFGFPVQAVSEKQTVKVRIRNRFIGPSIARQN